MGVSLLRPHDDDILQCALQINFANRFLWNKKYIGTRHFSIQEIIFWQDFQFCFRVTMAHTFEIDLTPNYIELCGMLKITKCYMGVFEGVQQKKMSQKIRNLNMVSIFQQKPWSKRFSAAKSTFSFWCCFRFVWLQLRQLVTWSTV